jgi:UDP-glucose:(heptosyl)LPS alpha-1,3-glucosyltransferase
MEIALCYESVLPARGGCETYITDLSRRLVADGHQVHLYASRWDAAALPPELKCHRLGEPRGPRFLRPWRFSTACVRALRQAPQLISLGFNKTFGQDILYPQAGLHVASADHNLRKHGHVAIRTAARAIRALDLAHRSYSLLERRQYLTAPRPIIIANSEMVRRHFRQYYGIAPAEVRVVRSAIDPRRFAEEDRPRRRAEWRDRWRIAPDDTVALFVAMNYELKGLAPLLRAVAGLRSDRSFRLVVVGNPRTARWQALARRLGIADRVSFTGHCPDTRNCYFAADLLVHPTFYDPCSLVVLEALACGLPVVTSRYNGACELLHPPQEGYVIGDPHDHSHLAWCLTQLLDPERRARCAQAARRAAAGWTFEQHYRQLVHVFGEAIARKHAA